MLPNVGPYIYTTLAFLTLLGAPYIYDISSLRVKYRSLPASNCSSGTYRNERATTQSCCVTYFSILSVQTAKHCYLVTEIALVMAWLVEWYLQGKPKYVCIYRVQNVFPRCPTPKLHCLLSSLWPSFRFLSFMAFFIPSIQFFFGLLRALFCFGIHFNAILGSLSSA